MFFINKFLPSNPKRFKPIFPAGARDFLMAVGTFPTKENLLTLVVVSIEKSEFPPDKSYTRAHLHVFIILIQHYFYLIFS